MPEFAGAVIETHFSRDGRHLLTIAGGEALVWDVTKRAPSTKPLVHGHSILTGAFSPDGKWIVTCSAEDREVRLWEAATASVKNSRPYPRGGGPKVVAFSPDGRSFVTGHVDGKVRIRRVDSPDSKETTCMHQAGVRAVSFSPDSGKVLTASDDWSARIWDASTGLAVTPPMMHQGYLHSAAFGGEGRYVITAGGDNTARVWEAATGRAVCLPLQHQASVQAAEMSRDGSTILTASYDSTARTWELPPTSPGQRRLDLTADVRMAAFQSDGKRLITVSQQPGHPNRAQLFDLESGGPLGAAVELGVDQLIGCAPGKDGRLVAATPNGTVHVCDLRNGRDVETSLAHSGLLRAICLHPDGRSLVTGTADGEVQVWDPRTGQRLGKPLPHNGEVKALAVSSDGTKLLVGCWDRWAHLWDLGTRTKLKGFVHQDPVSTVAFSPDGTLLATGGVGKVVRIWNASGMFEQRFQLGHPTAVGQAVFSHAGRLLATGCGDGAARLWDVVTGKQIGPPLFHDLSRSANSDRWVPGQIRSVEFSPDDKRVLTAGADPSLRTWPVREPLAGAVDDIIRHIEAVTVMELDPAGTPLISSCCRGSSAGSSRTAAIDSGMSFFLPFEPIFLDMPLAPVSVGEGALLLSLPRKRFPETEDAVARKRPDAVASKAAPAAAAKPGAAAASKPSQVVQQLFNMLQAANVEAVKVAETDGGCKALVRTLFFANGATGDASPLTPPTAYVGDYLVAYTAPTGETALLTRAQAEVIEDFWDLVSEVAGRQVGGIAPLGCCTNQAGVGTNNVTQSMCPIPPNQSWCQGQCGG